MRKKISIILAAALCITSLAGCGNSKEKEVKEGPKAETGSVSGELNIAVFQGGDGRYLLE